MSICGTLWWLPLTSLMAQIVKRLPTMWETRVRSLGREDPLEKEMATHSSVLAWKISWMEEPGGLQSVGWQRVRHDQVTSLHYGTPDRESLGNFLGETDVKTTLSEGPSSLDCWENREWALGEEQTQHRGSQQQHKKVACV